MRLTVVAERHVALDDRRPAVGIDLLRDHAEERGLACPVRSDERGALAEGEAERDILEEGVAGVAKAEIGYLEDGHRKGGALAWAPRRGSGPRVGPRLST